MLNLHFWSVFLDWTTTVLIIPFVLFPTVAGFSLGLLNHLRIPLELQCYLIAALLCTVNVAILTLFENRYFLMFGRETVWERFRWPVLISNYVLSFLYPLPAYLNFPEQTAALRRVFETLPPLPEAITRHQIIVYAADLRFFVIPILIMIAILGTEMLAIATLTYVNMIYGTRKNTISKKTLEIQRAILKAFVIQTATMTINFFIPIAYICSVIVLAYHNQALNNFCFVIFSLHGLTSTSIMLWSHKPYRGVCYKILRCRKPERKLSKATQIANGKVQRNTVHSFRHS